MRKLSALAFTGATLVCSVMAFGQKSKSPLTIQDLPAGYTVGPASLSPGNGQVNFDLPSGLLFVEGKAAEEFYNKSKQPVPPNILGVVADPDAHMQWYADISYETFGHVSDDDADEVLKNSAYLLTRMQELSREYYAKMPTGSQTPPQMLGWYKPPTYNPRTHVMTTELLSQEPGEKDQTINLNTFILGRYGGASYMIVGTRHDADLLEEKQKLLATCLHFAPGQDYASWRPTDGTSNMTFTSLITGGAVVAVATKTGLLAKVGSYLVALLLVLKKGFIAILAGGVAFMRWIKSKMAGKPAMSVASNSPDNPPNI